MRKLVALVLPLVAAVGLTPAASSAAARGGVEFSASTYHVVEGAVAVVSVTRNDALALGSAEVGYRTEDGTARAWRDYTPTSGVIEFAVGESERTFTVRTLDDGDAEPREQVVLVLFDPRGDVRRSESMALLEIADDDPSAPAPGTQVAPKGSSESVESAPRPRIARRRSPARRRGTPSAERTPRVTPFELRRPAVVGEPSPAPVSPGVLVGALVAAILLARVSARLWFSWRSGAFDERRATPS